MAIEDRLQVKYNQVCSKYQGYFTKPVYKFVRQLVFGILRARHVHVSRIARSLNEPITLKKTWERLSRQLGRAGLAAETTTAHLRENRRAFRSAAYWVMDLTDISKTYAKAMEGLAGVWDGSRGERGNGYWVVNAAGVSPKGDAVSLMYSELYSLEHETEKRASENSKILSAVAQLREHLGVARTLVLDRGGDRRVILENFLKNKQPFIIRQRGDRHIFNGGEYMSVSAAAAGIECVYQKTVMKIRKGKRRLIRFNGGAMRVYLPKEHGGMFSEALWLVRLTRRDGKAESWYLCGIGAENAEQAFETAIEGYGCRRKIEEVHRQIKTDYHLESVRLHRYAALKNFNALFWTAMNFIYQDLDGLTVELIESCEEKLSYKPSIRDVTGFCYYKLSRAVQLIFSRLRLYDLSRHYPPKAASRQLGLAFT